MFKKITFLLCLTFVVACSPKKDTYLQDLDFIYNVVLENHPGIYNKEDPNFINNLKTSYALAKSKIQQSSGEDGISQKAVINDFAQSFNDTHLWVYWFDNIQKKKNFIDTKIFITKFSKDVTWIAIPSFDLSLNQEKEFTKIIKNISELKAPQYIIFDLRKNLGGNSEYGSQIVDALFGVEYANQKRCFYNQNVYVDWRASQGNIKHISSLLEKYPKSNWLKTIEYGLQKTVQEKQNFYREHAYGTCNADKSTNSFSKHPELKVIIIIESVNVSAALDFIDELKMMTKNVTLIGQKTKADRLYMEVRSVTLPSEAGNFNFPIKVYRNRVRGDNEPYSPNIEFKDIDNTTALQNFILKKINRSEL